VRWPDFAPRATAAGFLSVLGQPLRLRDRRIGALNVFWDQPRDPADADTRLARGLADMAAIGILHSQALHEADAQVRNLEDALQHRAIVEQAKALIAERAGLDHGGAFDRLRRYARSRNLKLRDVARQVVDGDLDHSALT
jgi:GAF domain-containing protein